MALDGPQPGDELRTVRDIPVAVNKALLARVRNLIIDRADSGLVVLADVDPWVLEFGLEQPGPDSPSS